MNNTSNKIFPLYYRYDVLLRFGSGLDHSSLRKMIVSSLPARISSEQIIWIDGIGSTVEQWMINMSEGKETIFSCKYCALRAQLFTSLMADLCQDRNRVSSFA